MPSQNTPPPLPTPVEFTAVEALTPANKYWAVAILVGATFVAYLLCLKGDFILDDDLLITHNPQVRASDGLYRIWFTKEAFDYWPVTNTLFWLEWRMWKLNPTGYRFTNLILHIVDSLLLWLVLRKLAIPGAWLAALLFALHPVNVESVAWISQQKNVLALLFFLLSSWSWLMNQDRSSLKPILNCWYWLSLFFFVLAMLSKGSVAILPLVFLLIVWWRRGRIARLDVVACLPFLVVAAGLTLVNVWFQTHGSGNEIRQVTLIQRVLGAGAVVWFYLGKAVWPANLLFVYSQWNIEPSNPFWWCPLIATLAVTAGLWHFRSHTLVRSVLFAWLYFCIVLLPVMGFVDVGYMATSLVADHYEHLAVIGVVALAAAALVYWQSKLSPSHKLAIPVIVGVVTVSFVLLSFRQAELYGQPLRLYQSSLEQNPDSAPLLMMTGTELHKENRLQEAISHYEKAVKLSPSFAIAEFNWGGALTLMNRSSEAIPHFRRAIELVPSYSDAHYFLGQALEATGHPDEAEQEYRKVIESKNFYPSAHHSLGLLLASRKQFAEAIDQFKMSVQSDPEFLQGFINLASACAAEHRYQEAINYATDALKLAQSQGDAKAAEGLNARLKFYRDRLAGMPENTPARAEGAK